MDSDLTPIIQDLGAGLDALAAHSGIVFPPEVTGEIFMSELFEGGPATPPNRAFFVRLAVSLKHPGLQDQANLAEIAELIQARLAARRAVRG